MKQKHIIEVDSELLDYLKEPFRENPKEGNPDERWTRLEAYCDLIEKALCGFVCKSVKSQKAELKPFEFQTTISELADEWNWHRATVRSFLDFMEQSGQLTRKKLTKSVVIAMLRITDRSSQTDDITR